MHSREHESSAGEGRAQTLAVTRRSVVRAGAAAAWTAPLVQVLAPAPAQAVVSSNQLLLTGSFTHTAGAATVALSSGIVTNNGPSTTVNLQVSVTLDSTRSPGYATTTVATTPAGFTAGAGSSNGNAITFVFTATSQLASGATRAFSPTFTIPSGMTGKDGSGSATATATGFTPATTGNSYSG